MNNFEQSSTTTIDPWESQSEPGPWTDSVQPSQGVRQNAPFAQEAEVVRVDEASGTVGLTIVDQGTDESRSMPGPPSRHDLVARSTVGRLAVGERVLCISAGMNWFVIARVPSSSRGEQVIPLQNGERLVVDQQGQDVRLVDHEGAVRFAYDGGDRSITVTAVDGDLHLKSQTGGIHLDAKQGIEVRSNEAMRLEAPELNLKSHHSKWQSQDLEFSSTTVRFVAQRADWVVDTLMNVVRNLYSQVTELSQLRARRVRVIASEAAETHAGQFKVKASQDVTVDGRHVHLG